MSYTKIAEALAAAQKAFPTIKRGREVRVEHKDGKSHTYRYAELSDIIAGIRDPLADNGLAITQPIFVVEQGGPLELVTLLLHSSGETIESRYPLPDPSQRSAQEFGSAITYARRYSLTALLGIATDDDDDGAGAGAAAAKPAAGPKPASQPQIGKIFGVAKEKSALLTEDVLRRMILKKWPPTEGRLSKLSSPQASELIKRIQGFSEAEVAHAIELVKDVRLPEQPAEAGGADEAPPITADPPAPS